MWVVGKYALLQIPGIFGFGLVLFAGVRFWDLSVRTALLLLALWVLHDVVMFPFVRVAYEPTSPGGADALIGARGVVQRAIDPVGSVRVGSELWTAELAAGRDAIPTGAHVRVCELRGLTLIVEVDPS